MKTFLKIFAVLVLAVLIPLCASAEASDEELRALLGDYTEDEIKGALAARGITSIPTATDESGMFDLPKDANGRYIVPEGAVNLGDDGNGGAFFIELQDGVTLLRETGSNGLSIEEVTSDTAADAKERVQQFKLTGLNSSQESTLEEGGKVLLVTEDNFFTAGTVGSYSGGLLTLKKYADTKRTFFSYAKSFYVGMDRYSFNNTMKMNAKGDLIQGVTKAGSYDIQGTLNISGTFLGQAFPLYMRLVMTTSLDFTRENPKQKGSCIKLSLNNNAIDYAFKPFPFMYIDLPPFLQLNLSPELFVEAQAEGDVLLTMTYKETLDFKFDWTRGLLPEILTSRENEGPTFPNSEGNILGRLYFGFSVGPEVDFFYVVGLGIVYKLGVVFEGEKTPSGYEKGRASWHACKDQCVQGKGYAQFGPFTAQANFFGQIVPLFDISSPVKQDPFLYFYNSKEFNDSGSTACPHHAWRVRVNVTDINGNPLKGAEVSYSPTSPHYDEGVIAYTDEKGYADLYIPYDKTMSPATPDQVDVTARYQVWDYFVDDTVSYTARAEEGRLGFRLDIRGVKVQFRSTSAAPVKNMPLDTVFFLKYKKGINLPDNVPELSGYHFTGWNTEKDGKGMAYAPGQYLESLEDVTLYAQFELVNENYVVMYNANGGTGAPRPQITKLGESTELRSEPAVWGNHTFLGWSYEPDSAQADFPTEGINILENKENQRIITLYAVWSFDPVETPVKLSYDLNGGPETLVLPDRWVTKGGWLQIPREVPVWNSLYIFHGWSRDPYAGDSEYLPGEAICMTEDTVLYAVWKYSPAPTAVKVTFQDTGSGTASGLPGVIHTAPDVPVCLPDTIPVKSGQQFIGWNTKADGSGSFHMPGALVSAPEDLVLYAQWTILHSSYVVLYNPNGGETAPKAQVFSLGQEAHLSQEAAGWTGHTFLGWALEDDAYEPDYPAGKDNVIKNAEGKNLIVLYAVWSFDPVDMPIELSFDMYGGPEEQKPSDQWAAAGSVFVLESRKPVWDAQHAFMGWSEHPELTGNLYQPGDSLVLEKDTLLYAVWKIGYKIIEGDGGSWNAKTGGGLRFVADGNISWFYHLQIDGKVVYRERYDLSSGSTVAVLPDSLLKELGAGVHSITFVYYDGEAEGTFTITDPVPKTGDEGRPLGWLMMAIGGGAILAMMIIMSFKRRCAGYLDTRKKENI